MKKTVLYIAMSLDGCMTGESRAVEWLRRSKSNPEAAESCPELVRSVDTVVLDWNTYYRVATELSPGEWAYPGTENYVLTDRKMHPMDSVHFVSQQIESLLRDLNLQEGKNIWVFGGPEMVRKVLRAKLYDELVVTVSPRMQGKGICLFDSVGCRRELTLLSTFSRDGLVTLHYRVNE